MITPPAPGRLTSPFGMRDGELHDGQDIANVAGTPIWAAWPGVVTVAQTMHPGWGNQVILDHGTVDGGRTLTRYAHLQNPPPVTVGQQVAAGQQIGAMGTTGHSTGVHLHFGVYKGAAANYGTAVDPAPILAAREQYIMAMNPRRGADYSHAYSAARDKNEFRALLDRDRIAFCCRYILDAARDGGKRLTLAEARQLTAWGRRIVCNFEYEIGRMSAGSAAGVADAKTALAELRILGVPKGRPVYFSDDTGSTPAGAVQAYLKGAASVLGPAGYQTGVYGGLGTITAAYNAGFRWLWQTYAWSGGVWHPAATVRQILNRAFVGWDGDLNQAMTEDFGQWDTTGWTPQEDDMPLTSAEIQAVADAVWAKAVTNDSFETVAKSHKAHEMVVAGINNTGRVKALADTVSTIDGKVAALDGKVAGIRVTLTAEDKAEIISAIVAALHDQGAPRSGTWTSDNAPPA